MRTAATRSVHSLPFRPAAVAWCALCSLLAGGLSTVAQENQPRSARVTDGLEVLYDLRRLKTGQFLDVNAEGLDVYNTILSAVGAKRRLGPADREHREVSAIRA